MNPGEVELLSPAGDFESALAAFAYGADAVYCGLSDYSARAFAKNFSEDELRDLMRFARANGKKVYVTFNTLVEEREFEHAIERLALLEDIGVDGIIVQDLGIAKIARERFPGLALHASTQLVAHNLEGVVALKELGFKRVVLARELSLEETAFIAKRCRIELESFIHGALCYSLSGLCLFSAMEKGRSGNRGKCAYCCRMEHEGRHPFSMKDLRLAEGARSLAAAGVASLKIEGRMKSPLYVATVTDYYRHILDSKPGGVNLSDLETVFSRKTTDLYFNGEDSAGSVIDPSSPTHSGAEIGKVKRITKDREGRNWLRFHTSRALEKHDGLQFASGGDGGRPYGFGISEMRQAISRSNVFEVAAGTDVEVLLPEDCPDEALRSVIKPGDSIYCSMSNAVKRRFPSVPWRRSALPGAKPLDVKVELGSESISAEVSCGGESVRVERAGAFEKAKNPQATFQAVEKAFGKLGETDFRLGRLGVIDAESVFAPMGVLNDLRREAVEKLAGLHAANMRERIAAAVEARRTAAERMAGEAQAREALVTLKIRAGQDVAGLGGYDEIAIAIDDASKAGVEKLKAYIEDLRMPAGRIRLALPLYNKEKDFARLRVAVKGLVREGWTKWEAGDLAGLHMLKALGIDDVTADWSMYAFNSEALAQLFSLGVARVVASPENSASNLEELSAFGARVECITRQTVPLFISLNEPETRETADYRVVRRGRLWITSRKSPSRFDAPEGLSQRVDSSWDFAEVQND